VTRLTLLCFWSPRVHGSYEHLWAGQVADALVDLTGGLAERWNLKDLAETRGQQDKAHSWEHRTCRQLLRLKDRCLISCSVLNPRAGKVCGHSLSPPCPEHCLACYRPANNILLG
jgi:hypothetical protein